VSAFSQVKIVELSSGVAGEYCGKLLADFGAEVIKIEQPGSGSDTRQMGPFAASGPDAERSGMFAYLNTNKRSVALDLHEHAAKRSLLELLEGADVLILDHQKGHLGNFGLDPAQLAKRFPALIACAVTPFGYDAPAPLSKAYSVNVLHASWGYHTPAAADPAKPPLTGAGRFLPDYESGLSAALAVAAALYYREGSGRGQFLDVSQQESLCSLVDYVLAQMLAGQMEVGTRRQAYDLGGPSTFFKCRDGYVYIWMSEPAHWNGLSTLMGDPAWMKDFPDRWLERHVTQERIDRTRAEIARWMQDQSKPDVAMRAQKLGVPLVPVNTMREVSESVQMQFRRYFGEHEHPVLGRLRFPTVPYRLSVTPAVAAKPAPRLGEHTEECLKRAPALRATAPTTPAAPSLARMARPYPGPLQGVRVLEVTKIWAGPYFGKLLTYLGAEVIRVESLDSLDATRAFGTKDINDAPGFQAVNPGKLSVQINMKSAQGKHLVHELVKVCDIFVENLRPGAAERLELGYDTLRTLKQDIIAVSMSMYGHEGPLAYQTGYAPCFSSLAGVCHLSGYPDGAPVLLNQRYGDSSYGTAAAFAAVVALFHRRRTGQGQYVDVSAVESLSSMVADAFMDYFVTGRDPGRGAPHSDMAPYGVYPCAEAAWISIAVRTDEEWRSLCAAIGQTALAADPRFSDARSRVARCGELDAIVATWTRGRDAHQVAAQLKAAGVAAFMSLNSMDLVGDEHLWQRKFYTHVNDSKGESVAILGAPWHMSLTPPIIEHAAPLLGEHNDYVFGTLLGMTAEERQRLAAHKVIY
jgi:crotonobetainyl-CoA:carnitine CoA-transferase CaiB-like acyl-CoA transferase